MVLSVDLLLVCEFVLLYFVMCDVFDCFVLDVLVVLNDFGDVVDVLSVYGDVYGMCLSVVDVNLLKKLFCVFVVCDGGVLW